MRIRRLTLAGFGPYKNEQVVDFSHFDDAGLFLITGKTGAGKSSILDAICFALYGSVPRYDGTQALLRSDHCDVDDPSFVELDFTVAGVDYTVRRVPEYLRLKKNRSGTTKQAHEASLSRGGEVLAAKPVDVAHELADIVSLTKDQFLQVVLLAQNRFQQFLLAKNDDRQAVLRTLFGSERFEGIETALDDRRKALQAELASADGVLDEQTQQAARLLELDAPPADADADWFEAGLAGLTTARVAASDQASAADLAFSAADIEHRALLDVRALQTRRAAAATTLECLDDDAHEVAADRTTLDAARQAAPVGPLIDARERAHSALERSRAVEDAARAAYAPFDDTAFDDATDLHERIDALGATLGTLSDVLTDEKRLPALAVELERHAADVTLDERRLNEATARAAALPAELESIAARIADATARAARAPDAADAVARATTALESAQSAVDLEARLDLDSAAERDASGVHAAAAVELHELIERRLSGHAAELAEALVDGDPCAVCGSTAHPAPARHDRSPVTATDVEAAREHVAVCREAMDAAHEAVTATKNRLTEARARAEGRDVAALEVALAAASDTLSQATKAVDDAQAAEIEQSVVRAESDTVGALVDSARESLRANGTRLTEATSRRDAVLDRTEKHRDTFDTVSDRVVSLEQTLGAARALASAASDSGAKSDALRTATADLDGQLAAQSFNDAAEAQRALRDSAEISRLEARILAHETARATARATLDQPDIADAPEEPIDVEPARAARDAAFEARDRTRDAATAIARRADEFGVVATAARQQREATGQRRREFDQVRQLASVVRGEEPNTRRMRLETFVLAAQLEEIVAAANTRLRTMSAGRYALEHDDALQYRNTKSGLGLAIRDEHTGRARATHSLSGGEMFLASLALALGLAEVVTNQAGGITLDTLFIDEGFGSLDGDTLEIAMSTLDGLREGGRTIGLISHVEAMKQQIPAKLRITVSARGDSSIAESYEPA